MRLPNQRGAPSSEEVVWGSRSPLHTGPRARRPCPEGSPHCPLPPGPRVQGTKVMEGQGEFTPAPSISTPKCPQGPGCGREGGTGVLQTSPQEGSSQSSHAYQAAGKPTEESATAGGWANSPRCPPLCAILPTAPPPPRSLSQQRTRLAHLREKHSPPESMERILPAVGISGCVTHQPHKCGHGNSLSGESRRSSKEAAPWTDARGPAHPSTCSRG